MALHRDIYWVGRQWAVTGLGMQAVDQKQKSKFDIEVSRLWEDDLLEGLSAERWFNLEDFSKGLSIARARYPEPPGRVKPGPVKPVPVEPIPAKPIPSPAIERAQPREVVPPKPLPRVEPAKPVPRIVEPPKLAPLSLVMRVEGSGAKFSRMWRVRIKG